MGLAQFPMDVKGTALVMLAVIEQGGLAVRYPGSAKPFRGVRWSNQEVL